MLRHQDVSFTALDACYQNNLGKLFHLHVGNNNEGIAKILEHTGTGYHFVMEAIGVYYIRLAFFFHQRSCELSIANALSIKRFIQMHGERNKSDKKDAAWICAMLSNNGRRPGKCPTGLIFRASSFTTRSGHTKSRLSASTTSCTVLASCPFKAKTPYGQ